MDVGVAPDIWAFFQRCTMEARRVVFHARQAVTDLGGEAISAEHMLCGMLHTDILASRHLVALPMIAGELRRRLQGLMPAAASSPAAIDVPMSSEARQILNRAWAEAEALGHQKICSDHLLLGLLAGESAATALLKANGLALNAVRLAIPASDPDEAET